MRQLIVSVAIACLLPGSLVLAQTSPKPANTPDWRQWIKDHPTYPTPPASKPTPPPASATPSHLTPSEGPSICPGGQQKTAAAIACRELESMFGSDLLRQSAGEAVSANATDLARIPKLCETYRVESWKDFPTSNGTIIQAQWLSQPQVTETSFPGIYFVVGPLENRYSSGKKDRLTYRFFVVNQKQGGLTVRAFAGF